MPGAKRFHLAQKLATVALGAATLAVINPGMLPAQAAYVPPPTSTPPPGGYTAVVTSVTVGPAGARIGPVRIEGLLVTLTIPPGTFTTQVQITLTAPNLHGVIEPGFRAIGGVGVLIEVNGKPYTGSFGHQLTLDISGAGINSRDHLAAWNGKTFQPVGAIVSGDTVQVSFRASAADFVVLAPVGGGRGRPGAARTRFAAATHGNREGFVLTSLFLAPAGGSPAGIGVLAPEWLAAHSR